MFNVTKVPKGGVEKGGFKIPWLEREMISTASTKLEQFTLKDKRQNNYGKRLCITLHHSLIDWPTKTITMHACYTVDTGVQGDQLLM